MNLKRSAVSYRPFEAKAILQEGLLAVARPGGEVQNALADALFGVSKTFQGKAEATAVRKGRDAGAAAALANAPTLDVQGGDRGPDQLLNKASGRSTEPRDPTGEAPSAKSKRVPRYDGVKGIIANAAARHGISPALMVGIAQIESGLNASAKNPGSSAGGLFQQLDDNAAQYGVANRFDPAQSADGAARFARDNIAYLRKKLGRTPTWGETYLAHQQGAGGAVKLLSNPNVPVVQVLGRENVLKNGGTLDMTAGEYAARWTSKLDGGGARNPESDLGAMPAMDFGAADFSVVPGERSALSIEAGGGLAVTGRDTLYGRAFDDVAAQAYAARLQDQMLSAVDELSAKYADDPTELANALDLLKDRQMAADVPPAVRLDYEQAFGRVQRRALKQAQGEHEKRLRKADEDQWHQSAAGFEEAMGRAAVGLEPGDEDGLATLAGQAQRLKQHMREGVAKGFVSPKQAADFAQRMDSDVASQWYITQARDAAPQEVEDLRTTLENDYAAGKLKGVDAKGWTKIDNALSGMVADKKAEARNNAVQLATTTESLLNRVALGYQVAPEELNALRATAAKVDGGEGMVSDTMEILGLAETLRNRPLAEAEKQLAQMRDGMGKTPTDRQVAMYAKAEAMFDKARVALNTDPLGYGERAGVIEHAGRFDEVKTAQDMEGLIKGRLAAAATVAERFGVEPRYFRPGEVKQLEALVTANPDKGAQMAAAMIAGAGDKLGPVLGAFGKNAPVLAGAGAILAGGGDAVAARDALTTKDENGKPFKLNGERQRREEAEKLIDIALVNIPGGKDRVLGAAERIARKRIVEKGLDPEGLEAVNELERAVNEAAGAVYEGQVQWGGLGAYDPGFAYAEHKVVVPSSMRADRLAEVVDAITPEDLRQQPMGGIDVLQEQWPVWMGSGWHFVTVDDAGQQDVLMGTDNKPFVLPVAGLAQNLGKRVPGAFRGY